MIDPTIAAFSIERIAHELGATPADIAGLWNLPGFPELTTNQLYHVAAMEKHWSRDKIAATLLERP